MVVVVKHAFVFLLMVLFLCLIVLIRIGIDIISVLCLIVFLLRIGINIIRVIGCRYAAVKCPILNGSLWLFCILFLLALSAFHPPPLLAPVPQREKPPPVLDDRCTGTPL